jgi:hypothetical protein
MERSCVHCGYCCKTAPCGYGRQARKTTRCLYLIQVGELYYCGLYNAIQETEDSTPQGNGFPMFGSECCSPLFNNDRNHILRGKTDDNK